MKMRLSISSQSEKSPGSNIGCLTRGESLALAAFYRELNPGISYKLLEMFVLLRIHVFGFLDLLLSTFHGKFDSIFVDLFLGNGVFGEDTNLIALDLGETTADREDEGFRAFGDTKLSVVDLGEQRNMAGENTDLALNRRDDDAIYRIRVYFRFGRYDFEGEWHLGGSIK